MSKKSFKTDLINPAMQFISTPAERPATPALKTTDAPNGYKVNPLYIETKSKRLQLLVQPSLLEKLRSRAKAEGESVNNLIHSILEKGLKEE